ncbi:hypothetical protein AAHE18_19G077400 [Arachis hypogaea]
MDNVPYTSVVGSLMYAMVCTCPDISQAVSVVSSGFVDSDYASDLDKRQSKTSYVYKIYHAPVSWRSMLQATVALSNTKAEYMVVEEGMKEVLWLRSLLNDLGFKQDCVNFSCDSQGAIHLAKNQVHHARTNHIDVRYHFVRDIIEKGDISLVKVHINKNPADMLTKVVSKNKFQHCLDLLNIIPC